MQMVRLPHVTLCYCRGNLCDPGFDRCGTLFYFVAQEEALVEKDGSFLFRTRNAVDRLRMRKGLLGLA